MAGIPSAAELRNAAEQAWFATTLREIEKRARMGKYEFWVYFPPDDIACVPVAVFREALRTVGFTMEVNPDEYPDEERITWHNATQGIAATMRAFAIDATPESVFRWRVRSRLLDHANRLWRGDLALETETEVYSVIPPDAGVLAACDELRDLGYTLTHVEDGINIRW